MTNDLISRQAAIDAMKEIILVYDYISVEQELDAAITALVNLPSAQPEIIRCKDCKYGVDYYQDGKCYCLNPKWGLMYSGGSWEFFCADAKRRADDEQ